MADNLQTIRDYASSLQGDDRQSFIDKFNSIKDDDSKVNTLAGRIGGLNTNSPAVSIKKKDYLTPAVLGGVGALGAAGAAYGINKGIVQPWKSLAGANAGLRDIGNQYGITPEVSPSFIPKALGDKLQSTRATNQSQLQNVKTDIASQSKKLSSQLSDFDTTHVTNHSANLANTIKSNIPNVYKSTIDNYGKALDSIDTLAQNTGFNLSNKQFTSNVLDKVIEDAQKSGIDSKSVKNIVDTRDAILGNSKILDAKGNSIGNNMNLSDAKSVISNLTKEEPYSPLSAKIRESWANFLEKEAPDSVKPMYETLNKQYKPFAEARTFLNKMSNPSTGEFDSAGLSKYIEKYIKKGGDTGINNLMKLLGEGSPLVPKIDDLSNQFKNISSLKDQRTLLVNTLKDIQNSGATKINNTQQANLKKIQDLLESRSKANVLTDIADQASTKLNPLKAVGKMMLGRTKGLLAGIPFGVVAGELQKRAVGYDPGEAFQTWFDLQTGSPKQKDEIIKKLKDDYMKGMQT